MILNLLPPTALTAGCAPLYTVTKAVCRYLSVSRKREFLLATLGTVGQMCTLPSPHDKVTSALMSLIVCSVHILHVLHWSHIPVRGERGGSRVADGDTVGGAGLIEPIITESQATRKSWGCTHADAAVLHLLWYKTRGRCKSEVDHLFCHRVFTSVLIHQTWM